MLPRQRRLLFFLSSEGGAKHSGGSLSDLSSMAAFLFESDTPWQLAL